jgi:winged helix-turn-helix DNA-binding protein
MGEAGVVDLCRRLVVLTDELEVCREALKRALLNGGGGSERPFSLVPAGRLGAEEAEQAIVRLLGDQPGLRTAAVAAAVGAKLNTTSERLKRLRRKGEVMGGGSEGWRASTAG